MGWNLLFQEQNRDTARKLGYATLFMFTLPLVAFFVCANFVFHEKEFPDAWAGGVAVLVANVVIAGYVISAFSEEDEFSNSDKDGIGKGGPRAVKHKIRTD
uniref:Vacuolar ATPase assembly integral membrane protein VMA21 homolog n=1 Tax=Odontella aurita TaxID=265563 RepID=A0A7S4NDX7_9STRA|mmetsp:Transcript_59012/g.175467  ORF Transcript_59012/g.175467 Transcript_59012/m.175467 type:complete len:101 (+) Transcript_59012:245-547(+)|eukprot:CAMPEP_0113556110 /NCGR_PEP_ID=MMETSP0015_2-20120614/17079_1 /TAXON_ID=2838 /ORGANISM="Odontella" /LENGTH=100 /DNA_ID=CAMNT_0000457439 /DNA_START=245 /DNA_END=547 /DNA_ORIENTATION=- /assembly_acc=CAM_ASM_000160